MNLSITSNAVYGVRKEGRLEFLPHLGIAQCAQAGFERMEYNFLTGPADAKPLAKDNWRDTVARIRDTLLRHGVLAPYTHDYWYLLSKATDAASQDAQVLRSVEASAMLGSRLMVVHTQSVYDENGYNPQKTRAYNLDFFRRLGEQAARYEMQLAVENLFPIPGAIDFSSYPEELAELMEQLNDPMFGICWDFGHANMAKLNHEKALQTVAPWLLHIHVDDNKQVTDDHNIPGYGNVPWDQVMPLLKKLDYRGDITLSVRNFNYTTLPEQRVAALQYLHRVGSGLIEMFHGPC